MIRQNHASHTREKTNAKQIRGFGEIYVSWIVNRSARTAIKIDRRINSICLFAIFHRIYLLFLNLASFNIQMLHGQIISIVN